MSETKSVTTNVFLRGVDKTLRDRFKASCYQKGTTMKKEIVGFMRRCAEATGGGK